MKIILVIIEKSKTHHTYLSYKDKYKAFEHSETGLKKAIDYAKEHGYNSPTHLLKFSLSDKIGDASIFINNSDVDIKIMNQEIEI